MKDYYAITYDALDRIMDYVTAQEDWFWDISTGSASQSSLKSLKDAVLKISDTFSPITKDIKNGSLKLDSIRINPLDMKVAYDRAKVVAPTTAPSYWAQRSQDLFKKTIWYQNTSSVKRRIKPVKSFKFKW
jgi:hypothetical protein